MQCQFCKEEIIDGATTCRYCGKTQPPTPEERAELVKRRWIIGGSLFVVGVAIAIIMAAIAADQEQTHCAEAIAMTGGAGGWTVDRCLKMQQDLDNR